MAEWQGKGSGDGRGADAASSSAPVSAHLDHIRGVGEDGGHSGSELRGRGA